jgi:3-deoxy-manno-octulosonate cytidylyltransferase (CMP-KDO synthetase)
MIEKSAQIIIPSRMSSKRLPGKPLKMIGNKTMIQRVYERCKESDASDVYVATDSQEIYDHVSEFGKCILTPEFDNGTLRVCYASLRLDKNPDYIINVQGDEPFIDNHFLNSFIREIYSVGNRSILTGASLLNNENLRNRNSVKLIHDGSNRVISFTRSPFFGRCTNILKHVGIYGFKSEDIEEISNIKPSEESLNSSLEQISWMENGFSIKYAMCYHESICIDTQEDLDLARNAVLLDKIP